MQKLHLVGFTTDQKGLILSARRGARSGSFHLEVDEDLAEAVEELRAKQAEAAAELQEEAEASRPTRVESALSVREIQARLRQGRSVVDVAKAAGVDPDWVERFAAPVYAERAQVISRVRSSALRRARLGPSEHTIDESIRRNLSDRGVAVSPEELSESWSARQLADGRWAVRFRYRHRNRDQVVRFDLDEATEEVVAADRASSSLAYIAPSSPPPPRPSRPRPEPTVPPVVRAAPKRATVTVGYRPDDVAGTPTSRAAKERERASEAMRKAAVQAAAEAERAAARRAKEREAEAARRERAAKAEAARKERERLAAERARAAAAKKKAAAAKKRAAERAKAKAAKQAADQARRAEAALRAAERKEAARRKEAEKAARAATKKAAAPKEKGAPAKGANPKKKGAPAKGATPKRKAAPDTKPARMKKATPTRKPAAKKTKTAAKATARKRSRATAAKKPKTAAPTKPRTAAPREPEAAVKSETGAKETGAATKGPSPRRKATVARRIVTQPPPSARRLATPRPSASAPTPTRAVALPAAPSTDREPVGAPIGDHATGDVRIIGPVTSPVRVAPVFRAGLVETAQGPAAVPAEPSEPSPNGRARERPPGERRTRPLRAT